MKKNDTVYLWDNKIVCTKIESIKIEEIDGEKQPPLYSVNKYFAGISEWVGGEELFTTKQALIKSRIDEAVAELKAECARDSGVYYAAYKDGIKPSK